VSHLIEQPDGAGNECNDVDAGHVGIGVVKAILFEIQLIIRIDRATKRHKRIGGDYLAGKLGQASELVIVGTVLRPLATGSPILGGGAGV
jgi:hypothetical protein